ncbi:MAG: hypothetical protein OXG49_07565 [Chloroflexi bacterium]|nr:hypothetical protein [Chloroflexota bacterium]
MEGDWTQAIVMLAAIFGVFLWLRNDIKENRKEIDKLRTEMKGDVNQLRAEMKDDMQQLRSDIQNDMQQLRSDMKNDMQQLRSDMQGDLRRIETKVDGLDTRLRAVESEQSRVAGLLEGLGLAGVLPGDDS